MCSFVCLSTSYHRQIHTENIFLCAYRRKIRVFGFNASRILANSFTCEYFTLYTFKMPSSFSMSWAFSFSPVTDVGALSEKGCRYIQPVEIVQLYSVLSKYIHVHAGEARRQDDTTSRADRLVVFWAIRNIDIWNKTLFDTSESHLSISISFLSCVSSKNVCLIWVLNFRENIV